MNKNLVIYHMESINNCMYQMNSKYFSNLNRLQYDMKYYDQYYSTATSTFMVTSDLLYGNTDVFEHVRTAKGIYLVEVNEVSILEELSNENYDTEVLYYGNIDIDRKEKYYARVSPSALMSIMDTSEEFIQNFTRSVDKSTPFTIFIEDNAGHISYDGKRACKEMCSGKEKYCNRINKIDEAIGSIFAILEEKNKLKNTIVLLYGDHGDDMWMHGFNEGYAHALPPYNHMIHCPLFLYDSNEEGKVINTLIGTDNLKELILNHLYGIKKEVCVEYCYSRNLLANQKENISILNKSYSVTDGEYTLLVTRKGLELYMDLVDSMNLTNCLDFYTIKNDTIYFKDYLLKSRSVHFKKFMNRSQLVEIEERFENLRSLLMKYVSDKHRKDKHVDMDDNINYMKFDKIHYSKEMKWIKWYYVLEINKFCYKINVFKWKKWYNLFK